MAQVYNYVTCRNKISIPIILGRGTPIFGNHFFGQKVHLYRRTCPGSEYLPWRATRATCTIVARVWFPRSRTWSRKGARFVAIIAVGPSFLDGNNLSDETEGNTLTRRLQAVSGCHDEGGMGALCVTKGVIGFIYVRTVVR